MGGAVGLGHSSRCLAIANALLLYGHEVFACGRVFTSEAMWEPASTFFIADGVPYTIFPGPNPSATNPMWMRLDESEDAAQTHSLASSLNVDAVVIDHYEIGPEWLGAWKHDVPLTAISDGKHISAVSSIIDYGFDASLAKYGEALSDGVKVLAGSLFAPLSPKYERFRMPAPKGSRSSLKCLVSLGGSTPLEDVERIKKLIRNYLSTAEFLSVKGRVGDLGALSKPMTGKPAATLTTLEELFASADISIVSAGVTMYEFLASGSTGLVVMTADNQRGAFEAAKSRQLVKEMREDSLKEDLGQIEKQVAGAGDAKRLAWLTGRAAVDTFGAQRIASELFGDPNRHLSLRPFKPWDAPFLFRLVNQTSSREWFFSEGQISAKDHLAWFDQFQASTDMGFILEADSLPVGQCRLSTSDSVYELSYSILDEYQGRGLGTLMLAKLFRDYTLHKPVRARVKPGNIASLSALKRAKFSIEKGNSKEVVMIRWPD